MRSESRPGARSGRPIDRSALSRGLALIPRADLLVHVESPRPALEHRLQDRLSRRGVFERWYGNDLESWMRQAELGIQEIVLRIPGGDADVVLPVLDDYATLVSS